MNHPFEVTTPLDTSAFRELRLRTVFDCLKWDPQTEDVSVLARYPVVLSRSVWDQLALWAESLAAETIAAEAEILGKPALLKQLGLGRGIWKLLAANPSAIAGPRVMRFDFHFTSEGWRISEVNSDVPGGFIEAEGFTELMAEQYPGLKPSGLPARALADALARRSSCVAMVHASAYTDDRQVMLYLSRILEDQGVKTVLASPEQVRWENGQARIETEWFSGPVDSLYRFFPAEWLPNLRGTADWSAFFVYSTTPQCNPGWALVSQSKRFGLLLPQLDTELPAWKSLLPETIHPRGLPQGEDWVLKPALGRVGEAIGLMGITAAKHWRSIRRHAFLFPAFWVAQKRFDLLPLETPDGPRYFCFGVYTVAGRAAGVYGRCAQTPIINHTAQDVAVLLPEK